MNKGSWLLLSASLLLTACGGGGTVTPPAPEQPTPPASQYLPTAGFWDGKAASGPWCAGKVTAQAIGAQSVSPLSTPTAGMRALRGLSADLSGLSAQSVGTQELALLLPTDADAASGLARVEASGLAITGTFGHWVTARTSTEEARTLLAGGAVQYAERVPTFKAVGLPVPTDANLRNQDKYLPMMNTQAAWSQLELGCTHPVVAVIDTGWTGSTTHAEYNLVPRSAWLDAMRGVQGNADPISTVQGYEHGTSVASLIATTTNGYGAGASVSYNLAKVLPIAAMNPDGTLNGVAAARGIEYALGSTVIGGKTLVNPYPASVINLSFGSDATLSPSQFYQSFFDAAANKGVVVVAAVGNELAHGTTDTAGLNHSIGAAGVMFDGNRWVDPYTAGFGSNYGPGVDVAAPAMAVPAIVNGKEQYWSGTSMSAPWVSAQIAMWMYANQQYRADGSRTQGLHGDALYNKLYACFAAIGSNRGVKDEYLGYGKLDTARLVSPSETACR